MLAEQQEEHVSSWRRQFCQQKSYSDSDLNSGGSEFRGRPLSGYTSQDSRLASLASSLAASSSANSMSHYGSETAMELYNRAGQIQASISEELINKIMMEEEESDHGDIMLEPPVLKSYGDRQNSKCSSGKSR